MSERDYSADQAYRSDVMQGRPSTTEVEPGTLKGLAVGGLVLLVALGASKVMDQVYQEPQPIIRSK